MTGSSISAGFATCRARAISSGWCRRSKLHHATIGKEGGVSFGFIIALDPAKLKQELRRQRAAEIAVVRDAVD
jgi:hypothetical protein